METSDEICEGRQRRPLLPVRFRSAAAFGRSRRLFLF